MYCYNCGKQIPDNANFCRYYGASQAIINGGGAGGIPAPQDNSQPGAQSSESQYSYAGQQSPVQAQQQAAPQPQMPPVQQTQTGQGGTEILYREKKRRKFMIKMKWKRLGSFLITAVLVCGLCGCGGRNSSGTSAENGSSANTPEPEPLPTSQASFHTAAESFAGGSGTAEDPYLISTVEELALLVQHTRDEAEALDEVRTPPSDYRSASYVLTADIVFNDVSDFDNWGTSEPACRWAPVEGFRGTFDGGGHSISGLYLFKAGKEYEEMGMFAEASWGAVIKDLNLIRTYLFMDGIDSTPVDVGCLVGCATDSTIENCTVEGIVRAQNSGSYTLGGVVGRLSDSTLSGCRFTGTMDIQSSNIHLGGVVGSSTGDSELSYCISNCVSEGVLRLTDCSIGTAGGVVGYASDGCVVRDCVNRMDISGDTDNLGGVIGEASVGPAVEPETLEFIPGSFAAYDCRNEGTVESLTGQAGGVIGLVFNTDERVESLTLSGMVNSGAVTGVERVGGVIGEINSGCVPYTLENCENTGAVTGKKYTGGIIGYVSSCVDGCQIRGCANSGSITSESPSGGIAGAYMGMSLALNRTEGLLTIADCRNTGTVENLDGTSGTGGILGEIWMDDEEESVLLSNCENVGAVRSEGSAQMGGILGGPNSIMQVGSWIIRDCRNSGTLSFGSGTRDFAADSSLETGAMQSAAVDPTTMKESDYQASLEKQAIHALGGSCVGGIAGKLLHGTIEDCTAGGTILLDGEESCFAGGICGQFYNVGGDNGNLIRNCQYRQGWPFPAMAAIGTLEDLPEDAIVNVTASLEEP